MSLMGKVKKMGKMAEKVANMSESSKAKYYYPKYREKLAIEDKTIFLESRNGKEIAGNIFYLLKELTSNKEYKDYRIVITVDDAHREDTELLLKKYNITGYDFVRYCSKEYYKVLASAKYLVNDVAFSRYFFKRPEQIYLNTWHGTPWKCLGKSSSHDYYQYGNVQRNFMMADYLLYPNEYTMNHMLEDYTVKRLATKTKAYIAGYPRNTVFYKDTSKTRQRLIREGHIKDDTKMYFFMPTWREEMKGSPSQCLAPHLLMVKLLEMDELLNDDEIVFVKLHPLSKGVIDVSGLKHIKAFPQGYETYDFLSNCDALITDYSSVLFDFENSNKPIILWVYDKEDYLNDRGVYFGIDEYPYPQVRETEDVVKALRTVTEIPGRKSMKEKFTYAENKNACKQTLDMLLKGKSDLVKEVYPVVDAKSEKDKKLIVFYISSLIKNGITTSFMNLMNMIDTDKYHIVVSSTINAVRKTPEVIKELPDDVDYMGLWAGYNQTIFQSVVITLYYMRILPTWMVKGMLKKVYSKDIARLYPNMDVDAFVQFTGYEARKLMMYSFADTHRVCLVHNDMVKECKTRNNQHKGVLRHVYRTYDSIAVVNEALVEPTSTFIKNKKDLNKVIVVPNTITDKAIRDKGDEEIIFHDETVSTMPFDDILALLDNKKKVFVTIGRYSPEKDHDSLIKAFDKLNKENNGELGLIIIGGHGKSYNDTVELKDNTDPENKDIILIEGMRNPQPLLRKCDCFVMSSLYEGLPMVIFEADLQGLPVVTTDVSGMHYFIPKHNGMVTPTGVDGVYSGMKAFMEGKLNKLEIDYDQYNKECLEALDRAMFGKESK